MVCLLNLDRKLARYLLRKEGIGVKIPTQWGRLCEKWISACARCGLKKWMCLSYCTPLFSRLMARQEFVHFYGRKMCRNRCSLVVPLIRYKTLYLLIWKIRYPEDSRYSFDYLLVGSLERTYLRFFGSHTRGNRFHWKVWSRSWYRGVEVREEKEDSSHDDR